MLLLCFKLPACLFGNTRDTSVMHEKEERKLGSGIDTVKNHTCPRIPGKQNVFVLFMDNSKKVKFKSVQINMKQVSYIKRRK